MDALRRWRRGITEAHRERCAELAAPWVETTQPVQDNATMLRIRVRPLSPGGSQGFIFPGKALFSFVRRVYHCCQEGLQCGGVKGIQGRLSGDVEFLLTRDVLSAGVKKAELHLQLFNPGHLDIQPVLPSMAKRSLPTRYSSWSQGDTVELRVDLLFLFRGLQEAAGGAGGGPSLVHMRRVGFFSRRGPPLPPRERSAPRSLQDTQGDVRGEGLSALPGLELGLALGCSRAGSAESCEPSGVHLLHSPFVALSYR
ncbi:uncharacterized protein LOC115365726 [Myripristis murdjan]|nr:uncharacterized protein LOC115365726 [Myripristis murdjan]